MYKLTVINNKFRLFSKRETTQIFETSEELLNAIDEVDPNKSYYITDENGEAVTDENGTQLTERKFYNEDDEYKWSIVQKNRCFSQ